MTTPSIRARISPQCVPRARAACVRGGVSSAGAAPAPSRRTALASLAGPLVLLAGAKCWAQDGAWRGPIELWGHAYGVNPRGVLVAEEYGSAGGSGSGKPSPEHPLAV